MKLGDGIASSLHISAHFWDLQIPKDIKKMYKHMGAGGDAGCWPGEHKVDLRFG